MCYKQVLELHPLRWIKGLGVVISVSVVVLLAVAAFVVFTPVDVSNVGKRLTMVCQGYRFAARHIYPDRLDYVWARNVDCGCVLTTAQTQGNLPAYAQFLERFRTAGIENAGQVLSGAEPTADPMADPAIQQIVGSLPMTIALCQRFAT